MLKKHKNSYFLDRFSLRDVRLQRQRYQTVADYFWDHYCYFSQQRSFIIAELKTALASNCCSYSFSKGQRVLNYKFSLEPLSARGSIVNDPGGRFNIGDIDQIKFPRFPALYLAEDRETAYREKYGLDQNEKRNGLTSNELQFTSKDSITIVTLKGEINQVINLNKTSLQDFFDSVKKIKISDNLIKRANKLNIDPMYHVKTIKELLDSLLWDNWREIPMLFDIPAASQIFGQIAYAAGIEAILYPSKLTKKNCLAVFPENFAQSTSFIEIADDVPSAVKYKKLDSQSCLQCI